MDHTLDLGTKSITRLFLEYSIPSVIGMLFFSVYIVIDGIFVGQVVGSSALAAINIAMPFFSIAMAISIMVSSGANTIVGIELGRGETAKARKTFSLAFYTLIILSSTIGLGTLIFLDPIAKLLGATEELLPMVKQYLATLCVFVPVFTSGGLLSAGIRTMGKPNYAMLCSIVGSVLNIILDYIFVIPLGMGVFGAALASGLAFMVAFFVGFIPYLSKSTVLRFTTCKVDFKKIGKFFYNGSSEALTEIAVAFTTYLFNIVLLQRVGEMGVSAFSIISYVTSLVIAVLLGIATGISPIISYNLGARKGDRIIQLNNLAIKVMVILGVLCTLSMLVFGKSLIGLFTANDPALVEMTAWASSLYSLCFLFNGVNVLASAYFTALENAKISALISALRGIVFIVVGIIVLPPILGDAGIWLTVLFSETLTLFWSILLFKKSYRTLRSSHH
ncbi:MAG: MATE family efflux transporter [Cellulosilyticaceae bacterium]